MSIKPTHRVLTKPEPGTVVNPTHKYTKEQQFQINALHQYTRGLLLPTSDPYYPWELCWLQKRDTIPRYMRAAKWNFPDAQKHIKATLEWRRAFRPDLIPPDEVKIESETGEIILTGFDRGGQPIIYIRPGRENTETSLRQLRYLVWCVERAKDLMPPGQEYLVIIFVYESTTLHTNPCMSVARKVLNILQQHYVETLGSALIVNLPLLLTCFYKAISLFLDPVTRDKIHFNPNLVEFIPPSQLDADFGGSYYFKFEPESYWDQILTACKIAPDGTRLTPTTSTTTTSSIKSRSSIASLSVPHSETATANNTCMAGDFHDAADADYYCW
ncbi:CRAL-TRIO domain-containing protein C23B6.04c [Leucoagaricus sp. SymC.cos]|nr:CRAL-TRIO domain-containing protein C23B6.04c [Leucoagaricus sp. SymC.cos]